MFVTLLMAQRATLTLRPMMVQRLTRRLVMKWKPMRLLLQPRRQSPILNRKHQLLR